METVYSLVPTKFLSTVIKLMLYYFYFISVELESLGPLLGQIVVALYPVINERPHQVEEIFNYLIVENRLLHTYI